MNKYLILCIGDLHISPRILTYMDIIKGKLLKSIKVNRPDFVVFLGDILHNHDRINMRLYKEVIDLFKVISDLVPTFLIIGNHDRENNSKFESNSHAFNALKYWNNFFVVDSPTAIQVRNNSMKLVTPETYGEFDTFIFMPYVPVGKFLSYLGNYKVLFPFTKLIFAHQEFRGCKLSSNLISSKGDIWDPSYPVIVSGHIHEYQRFNNIIYPGTPYQTSIKESTNKGIMFISIDENIKLSRFSLGVPIIETKIINIDEIEDIKEVPDTRIIVQGSQEKLISNLDRIKNLTSNFKLKFTKEKSNHSNVSFIEILRSKLDKESLELLDEIYT